MSKIASELARQSYEIQSLPNPKKDFRNWNPNTKAAKLSEIVATAQTSKKEKKNVKKKKINENNTFPKLKLV